MKDMTNECDCSCDIVDDLMDAHQEAHQGMAVEVAAEDIEDEEYSPSIGEHSAFRLLQSSSSEWDTSCSELSDDEMYEYYRFKTPLALGSGSSGWDSPTQAPATTSSGDFSNLLAFNDLQDQAPRSERSKRPHAIPPVSYSLIQGFVSTYPVGERAKALKTVTALVTHMEPWLPRPCAEGEKEEGPGS